MAAFLYILQSQTSGKYYVGSTDDLDRRLSEHARNHTPSTRRRGPWTLVHKEEFASLLDARRRELEIKRWKSARRYHGRGEMGDGAETGKLVMSRLRAQFAE